MIDTGYVRAMARYNRWQNRSLYTAAAGLTDAARQADRGAFFGSIHGTLSHVLWGDTIWMSRFDGWTPPEVPGPQSASWIADWADLSARRAEADAGILDWAARITDADFQGTLAWYSGATGRDMERPRALCIAHFFNHQTHHRGQVHAMLTGAGARPDDTDLVFMPDTD